MRLQRQGGKPEALIASLREKAIFLPREHTEEAFPDEDDIVFFEIALSGRSRMDAYLVTGNLKHYPVRSYVATPRQMLEIIEVMYVKMNNPTKLKDCASRDPSICEICLLSTVGR